ncbi:MAG: YdcF family protein [Proteobacteria bacterium]|nr:YdcF family protein [Pseudomonadota bacterium]
MQTNNMMDSVFFVASKLIWAVISPDSLIVLLGVLAWISLVIGWQKLSRRLLSACALLLLLVGFLPLGEWLIAPLENRFAANTALPAEADGIIVLGGAISPVDSQAWNQVEIGSAGDRLTNFLYLAGLFPDAQLVFTGGSGAVTQQEFKEAEFAQYLFEQLGVTDRAIIYESESRNTFENALNSKELLSPAEGEKWILITSAFHMPRSVGIFCQQEWVVTPYPVDHYSRKGDLLRVEFNFSGNLSLLVTAVKEWVGLVAYRITGRTDQLLPGSENYCGVPLTEEARGL